MNKKILRRIGSVAAAGALCALAVGMFAGCTTDTPKITITYTFNDKDYAVEYTLSRTSAPQTVQHFIELADAGYYEGMIIHDYDSVFMYGGGYTLNEEGELVEKDYYTEIKRLEGEKNFKMTQTVFSTDNDEPLYSVYGEMTAQFNYTGTRYSHTRGALVMYYADKGNSNYRVKTLRNDKGENNDGDEYQTSLYKYNSATSMFYTFMGESRYDLDAKYCVFGMASNYEEQMTNGLLAAIHEYEEGLGEDEEFTTEMSGIKLNQYDPFKDIRNGDTATYSTPVNKPIVIKSVKVNKY